MKVCFIAKDLTMGGTAGYGGHKRFVFDLVSTVRNSGIDVLVLAEKISNFSDEIESIDGIKLGVGFLKRYFKIRSAIKQCDIIHALDGWPSGFIGYLLIMGLDKKFIVTTEGTSAVKPLYSFPRGFLLKKTYRSANVITAISRFTASEISRFVSKPVPIVITPGVDPSQFGNLSNLSLSKKTERYKPYILSVGDVRDRKGYHISVKAFAKVSKHISDLNYVIVGYKKNDEYVRGILDIVRSNKLEDRVHFLEDIDDDYLKELYSHAKLFLLHPININHDFEGFGLVFLEAAIYGIPTITTENNGSVDAIIEGETGLVVRQGDVEELAGAIEKIVKNKDLKNYFGANGRKFAQEMSWTGSIEKYIKIYNSLNG